MENFRLKIKDKKLMNKITIIMVILQILFLIGMFFIAIKLNSFKDACQVCEEIYGRTCLNLTF